MARRWNFHRRYRKRGQILLFGRAKGFVRKLLGCNTGVLGSMRKKTMNFPKKKTKPSSAAGFSVVELLVVILVVTITSTFALVSFQKANWSFNLSGATRTLSAYLEKARVESVRGHGNATVVIDSTSIYTANIDFIGNTPTPRTITLPAGTSLSYTLPPSTTSIDPSSTPITITYDWRW